MIRPQLALIYGSSALPVFRMHFQFFAQYCRFSMIQEPEPTADDTHTENVASWDQIRHGPKMVGSNYVTDRKWWTRLVRNHRL